MDQEAMVSECATTVSPSSTSARWFRRALVVAGSVAAGWLLSTAASQAFADETSNASADAPLFSQLSGGFLTPLANQTTGVTNTLRPVTNQAGAVLYSATAPVTSTAAPVVATAGDQLSTVAECPAVRRLTSDVSETTEPLVAPVDSVIDPLQRVLDPVTEPLDKAVAPLTSPIHEQVAPALGVEQLINAVHSMPMSRMVKHHIASTAPAVEQKSEAKPFAVRQAPQQSALPERRHSHRRAVATVSRMSPHSDAGKGNSPSSPFSPSGSVNTPAAPSTSSGAGGSGGVNGGGSGFALLNSDGCDYLQAVELRRAADAQDCLPVIAEDSTSSPD